MTGPRRDPRGCGGTGARRSHHPQHPIFSQRIARLLRVLQPPHRPVLGARSCSVPASSQGSEPGLQLALRSDRGNLRQALLRGTCLNTLLRRSTCEGTSVKLSSEEPASTPYSRGQRAIAVAMTNLSQPKPATRFWPSPTSRCAVTHKLCPVAVGPQVTPSVAGPSHAFDPSPTPAICGGI